MQESELNKIIATLGDHVAVSRDRITPAMIEQTGLYAYYAVSHARALRDERTLKLSVDNRRAVLRRSLSQSTAGRITEAMIDEACASDKQFRDLSTQYIEAQFCADVLESVTRAFEHRRDMLVNLGATVREEMRSIDLRTPDKSRREQQHEQRRDGQVATPPVGLFAIGSKEGSYYWGPGPYGEAIDQQPKPGDMIFMLNPDGKVSQIVAKSKLGQWQHDSGMLQRYFDERGGVYFRPDEIPF